MTVGLTLLAIFAACNDTRTHGAQNGELRTPKEPSTHVPTPTEFVVPSRSAKREGSNDPFPDWPPTLHQEHLRAKPGELHEAPTPKKKSPRVNVPAQVEDRINQEVTEWLRDASELAPGCLLNNTPSPIWIPSPEGLNRLLGGQPETFTGVAREALLCALGIQRLTAAELYGATAFLPAVASARLHLVGGDRALGVVAFGLHTEVPRGEGTAVLVLDERSGQWMIRSARWIPWTGDGSNRRVVSLKGVRVVDSRRQALIIHQEAEAMGRKQIVAMSPSDHLSLVFDQPTKTQTFTQDLIVRGPGWPRAIVARQYDKEAARWLLSRWESEPNDVYQRVLQVEGSLQATDMKDALDAGFARDVTWLIGRAPARDRKSANLLALRAQAAVALKKHSRAKKYWRKATRAPDATPEHGRDYGLYLATRKKPGKAESLLREYLAARPEAADRLDVEIVLDNLGATP